MEFKLALNNKTHKEVEIKRIDFEKYLVIFKNIDGFCMAPLKAYKGKIPTENEIQLSVEDVLGELKEKLDG